MTEAQIEHSIRLALGQEFDLVLWRNTTGFVKHEDRAYRYGLCPGGSDLIGILKPSGRFVALEIKAPKGKATELQQQFINLIRSFGGFACVVRSVEEAKAALSRARAGENS